MAKSDFPPEQPQEKSQPKQEQAPKNQQQKAQQKPQQQPKGAPAQKPQQKGAPLPKGSGQGPVDSTGMGVDSNDPQIAQVQDAVRKAIPAQFRVPVQRIVLAGMKVMFSQQTHPLMLQALQSDTDLAHAVGMGVTQLITILFKQAKGQMPIPAVIPAAILLVCEALDFVEKSKIGQVTPQVVANAVQVTTAYLLQKLGLSPQKVSQLAQHGGQGQPGVAPIQGQDPWAAAAQQAGGAPQGAPQPPQQPQASGPQGGLVQQQLGG
ncbi:hypothetical protein [Paraburkholderia youngii]|uniref:hypothetical protein n=1 Tax=Paraburkholderia youngii TaxID=2782701 RepID=UPI00158FEDFC|nr:hypothetical protein [Paraburkholderia youngii]NUX58643.1 hypothetical protein [Paraburkholderia youngii]